jgi:hypothetical protein
MVSPTHQMRAARDDAGGVETERAEARAHDGREGGAEEGEPKDVPRLVELRPEGDAPDEGRAEHGLERVARGDHRRRERAHAGARCVGEEGAERHARPQPPRPEEQRGEGEPGRRPDERDAVPDRGHVQASLGEDEIGPREHQHTEQVSPRVHAGEV